MNIERLRKIIEYSDLNREAINAKIKDFYSFSGMSSDKEVLNIMQIARPSFEKKGDYTEKKRKKSCTLGLCPSFADAPSCGHLYINHDDTPTVDSKHHEYYLQFPFLCTKCGTWIEFLYGKGMGSKRRSH